MNKNTKILIVKVTLLLIGFIEGFIARGRIERNEDFLLSLVPLLIMAGFFIFKPIE
jgi:hypothetical protein